MKIILIAAIFSFSNILWARTTTETYASCKASDISNTNQGLSDILTIGETMSEKEIAYELCNIYGGAPGRGKDSLKEITNFILKQEVLPEDTENWEPIVIGFLNKYGEKLICPKSGSEALYDNEHFYKRAVSYYQFEIFYDLLTDDEYPVELNMIQIRNGKKETLLDFIEARKKKGVSSELERELNSLISDLRELGAKYAREL